MHAKPVHPPQAALLSRPSAAPSPAAMQRLLFVVLCTVWGTTWLAMKIGISEIPPGIFSGLRWTAAGLILLVWRRARGQPVWIGRRLAGRLVLVAILMVAFNAVIMLYGLRYVSSGLAAVITSALTPIALLGFGIAMGQEKFSLTQAGAIVLGICGILLLFGSAAFQGRLDPMEVVGAAGIIIGCVSYCAGSVVARPLMRTVPPAQLAAITNFIGGGILIVLCLLFEPGAREAMAGNWGWGPWLAWLYLLLPGSLGATIIYFFLVRDWGASRAGTYAFVSPVIAVLLGVATYGEELHATDALGMVLMLVAAGLVILRR